MIMMIMMMMVVVVVIIIIIIMKVVMMDYDEYANFGCNTIHAFLNKELLYSEPTCRMPKYLKNLYY